MPQPKYPHMRIWEESIMDKFHDKKLLNATYDYDVHLRVRDTNKKADLTPNEQILWNQQTAKRIDAVATTPATIYVIEVKDRLRPSAVGQAITYKILYEEQFKPTKLVIPAIITEFDDPDMRHVCDVLGIRVWVV
jgi:hypothetical protein